MLKKIKNNVFTIVVFVIFAVVMFMKFRLTWMYYDDYGYYSLNYGSNLVHIGDNYTIWELFPYLKEHYVNANGRLLYFFIWLVIYRIGGLHLVQAVAATIMTGLMFAIYRIVSAQEKNSLWRGFRAAAVCVCYGLISQAIHQHGTYWHVAFYLYYTPVLLLAIFALIWQKNELRKSKAGIASLTVISFLVGWSVENLSVAFVIMLSILLIYKCVKNHRFAVSEFLYTVAASIGTVILVKSPGIMSRAASRGAVGNPVQYVQRNIANTFIAFLSHSNRIFIVALMLSSIILSCKLYSEKKKPLYIVTSTILGLGIFIEVLSPLMNETLAAAGLTGIALCLIILASVVIPVVGYCVSKENMARNLILITAFFSVACMAMVPEIQARVFIPFMFCSFAVISEALLVLLRIVLDKETIFKRLASAAIIAGVLAISVLNFSKTYLGYSHNYQVNVENDRRLKAAATKIAAGENIMVVELIKFDDEYEQYASCMYYQEGMQWFKSYIDYFYNIPSYVEYIYRD